MAGLKYKSGDVYNKLTLTGKSYTDKDGNRWVECLCECDKIVFKRLSSFIAGRNVVCGNYNCKYESQFKAGDKYNSVTLTGGFRMNKYRMEVECKCICGKIWFCYLLHLKKGIIKSCGCKNVEFNIKRSTKHGLFVGGVHPIVNAWNNMRSRCYDVDGEQYKDYGGRGIEICEEWDDAAVFYDWALNNGWKEGLTIDRVKNDKGYSTENCRWVNRLVQNRNTRSNVLVEAFGEVKCAAAWADSDICEVSASVIRNRIKKLGWDAEKAISTPQMR